MELHGVEMLKKVQLVMVVSSFCSKCHYNNKLLSEVLPENMEVYEINVGCKEAQPLIDYLHPMSSPTLYLLNDDNIVYSHEGVLTSEIIHAILKMYYKLKKR